jgi:hypothetical protein
MCTIYDTIGSLTNIKSRLEQNSIRDFKSLRDVINFQNSYTTLYQQLLAHHEHLIEQEKNNLKTDLQHLEIAIETQRQQSKQQLIDEINKLRQQLSTPKNFFEQLIKGLKNRSYKRKIKQKENNFDIEVAISVSSLVDSYQTKSNRYQFIITHTAEAVTRSAQQSLSELERKKAVIDELNTSIYGALGEQKVVKALKSLSDDYFLINNFDISFYPSIHYRQENTTIKSIQIDHILVGPTGLFLIETKNWSGKSLENLSLRSPVQQIKRASFVLFKLLNNELSNDFLGLKRHHWGDKKISIRNLIVLTNARPKEEFQYVKVLTLNELLSYINYFEPLFTSPEIQRIANFLVDINNRKKVQSATGKIGNIF